MNTIEMESKTLLTPFVKQCFVTAGVSINMAGSGLVVGFTAQLLQQLQDPDSIITIDDSSGSWIAAIPGFSLVIGNFMAPPLMAKYGRKLANIFSILPLIASWLCIYFAEDFIVLFLTRLLQGICMGMCTSLASVLIGEYTSPRNRGAFLMTISVSIAVAVMAVHALGSYLSWKNTALVCGAIAFVDLFIVIFSPESPSWLCNKGRYDECKRCFRWLRGNEEEDELKKLIQASIILKEAEADVVKPKSLAKRFRMKMEYFNVTIKKKEFFKPIFIMIHMYLLSQWSGLNILVAFPIDLFKRIAGKDANIPLLIMTLDANRIIVNTLALFVIKKVKRRTIMIVNISLNILALVACGSYYMAKKEGYISSDEFTLGIILVHIHMFSIAMGSLPLCFIIAGEIFPLEYRSLAGGISVLFYSANLFITLKTTPYFLSTIDLHGTYFVFATVLVYGLFVVWFLLPETKDRTLQDIEDEFRGRPLTMAEVKSAQSLTSWKANATTDRRCSTPMAL